MGFEGFVSEFGSLKYIGLPRGKLQHACLFCHDNLRVSRQGWRVDGCVQRGLFKERSGLTETRKAAAERSQ